MVVRGSGMKIKEPVNAYTHLAGGIAALPAVAYLICQAALYAGVWHVVSFSIYGASLVGLYLASGMYHMLTVSDKTEMRLKKLDHMMIFLLIAGTYTPLCLIPLRGPWGWALFGIIWGAALGGILLKLFWIGAPRWLSTAFYIVMGWMCVIAIYPLIQKLPVGALSLLLGGGVLYTVGGIIYGTKRFPLHIRHLGFHEIFHIFVLGGSVCHYSMMVLYLLPMR